MPVLKNTKHELFAQQVATGKTALEAYKTVYKSRDSICETNGPRLLRNAQVEARVAEIKGKAADEVGWTIKERLEFLKKCAVTPPDKIKLSDSVCQGQRYSADGSPYLLVPDKIKACVEYSRLAGDLKDKGDTRPLLSGSFEEALVKLMYGELPATPQR